MKASFKPLSLAAAVAAASVGYAGMANAAATLSDNSGLGDMAIVPYYSTSAGFSTGISIINTSSATQVVKLRLRRAKDSMDALDFNIVLSPDDVWTGYVQASADTDSQDRAIIRFYSNDTSCQVPELGADGYQEMSTIYREGARTGYIEVVAMGSPINESQPIAVSAKHINGVPKNCERVSDNFRRGATPSDYGSTLANPNRRGTISSVLTHQWTSSSDQTPRPSSYTDSGNVLKVSYFISNDINGVEFGNDAVHFSDFLDGATMTNQTVGIFEGDLQGFDHPDLNGGAPFSVIDGVDGAAGRDKYEDVRAAIGADRVINDWSENLKASFSVDTDWIITTPGQYLMTNQYGFLASLSDDGLIEGGSIKCLSGDPSQPWTGTVNCDFRDIPMVANTIVWDREETGILVAEDDLVVSPRPPGEIVENVLRQEVNVISWGVRPVIPVDEDGPVIEIPKPPGAIAGWADLRVEPNAHSRAICKFTALSAGENGRPSLSNPMPQQCDPVTSAPPLVGFVAWQRNFSDRPLSNYGRIVEHSYILSSSGS
jgi:hypothetical protein